MLGSQNRDYFRGEEASGNSRHAGEKEIRWRGNDRKEGEKDPGGKRRKNKNVYWESVEKCGTCGAAFIRKIETKWKKDAVYREEEEVWGGEEEN